ncbi:MAG: GNAT family N-acetyltransferase [Acidimicrobiales bacterium]
MYSADDVTEAILAEFAQFASTHPGGWARREGGLSTFYTGIPVPNFNGVVVEREGVDLGLIGSRLDEFESNGVPYGVYVRSDEYVDVFAIAKARGLNIKEAVPLMVFAPTAHMTVDEIPTGLSIRQVVSDDVDEYADIAAAAFGMPHEIARQSMSREVLARNGVRGYIGDIDGRPVATSVGVTNGDSVGIFNVGTVESARRRGYGREITVRAISDGVKNGAKWSYLQSSPAGLSIYRRIGYETLETWTHFLPG